MGKRISILAVFSMFTFLTFSQSDLEIDQTLTPQELVEQVLVGAGVTVSNVQYNGNQANAQIPQVNVSRFDASATTFPLSNGVFLSTGNGNVAIGPNNATGSSDATGTFNVSDPDLNAIASGSITNGVDLEFDFVPAGDTLQFQYIFVSEEYPEFAPPNSSGFNDAFGFFISGPGIAGTFENNGLNIATLPDGTTPVTINNVNPQFNSEFYVDAFDAVHFQHDGRTVTMTAKIGVECGETYHIKMVIGNVADQSHDSGVFLEANSFSSDVVDVTVATVTGDTSLVEGCGTAEIIFSRPQDAADTALTINFDLSGDAINGDDYTEIDTFVTFPAGEDTVVLSLTPLVDNTAEGPESVTITAYTISTCGDTIVSEGTVYIIDEPDIQIAMMDSLINCPNDSVFNGAVASGGHAPYQYVWETGVANDSAYFDGTAEGDTYYTVTVTDDCGFEEIDSFKITLNPAFYIDTILKQDSDCITAPGQGNGYVSAQMNPLTNNYSYTWEDQAGNDISASVWSDLDPGWYFFSVEFEGCELKDSIQIFPINTPIADYVATPMSGTAPLTVDFDNQSQNATVFNWNLYVDTFTVNNMGSQSATYTSGGDYLTTLIVENENGCTDTASIIISVVEYNPIIFEQPNVFTPNGDNANEVFDMKIENSNDYSVVIRNRWGNKITTLTPENPTWDGKTGAGADVSEGTYFYYYEIEPLDSAQEKVVGQGFVVVKRN